MRSGNFRQLMQHDPEQVGSRTLRSDKLNGFQGCKNSKAGLIKMEFNRAIKVQPRFISNSDSCN